MARIHRPLVLIAALVAGLLLSACIEAEMKSELKDDGSAVHTYTVQLDKDTMEGLSGLGGETTEELNFDEEVERAREMGLEAEAIDNEDYVGMRVWQEVEDNSDIGAVFNDLFTAAAAEGEEAPLDAVTGSYTKDDGDWVLDLTFDSDKMFGASGLDEQGGSVEQMEDFIEFTYVAIMPGDIKEVDELGEETENNTVEWELPLSGQTSVRAVSSSGGGGGSSSMFILIGLIALLVLGALVSFWLFSQRRRPAPAPVGATVPPPATFPPAFDASVTAPPAPPTGGSTQPAQDAGYPTIPPQPAPSLDEYPTVPAPPSDTGASEYPPDASDAPDVPDAPRRPDQQS